MRIKITYVQFDYKSSFPPSSAFLRRPSPASVFGAATNARAWSAYLDFLTGHAVADYLRSHVADWSSLGPPLGPHPDLLAGSVAVLLSLVVAGGASCSARVNSAFALVNVAVLVFFIVVGFTFADVTNWTGDVTPLAASEVSILNRCRFHVRRRHQLDGWRHAARRVRGE